MLINERDNYVDEAGQILSFSSCVNDLKLKCVCVAECACGCMMCVHTRSTLCSLMFAHQFLIMPVFMMVTLLSVYINAILNQLQETIK